MTADIAEQPPPAGLPMRSPQSLTPVLASLALLATFAPSASAQLRARVKVPPTRVPSTLSTADSTALVAAAARVAVLALPTCVAAVGSDVSGPAGEAFVRAVTSSLRATPAQSPDGSSFGLRLVGLEDGDTASVSVKSTSGDSLRFSENWIAYYFVRTTDTTAWRPVGRMVGGYGDYVIEPGQKKRRRKPCLTGSAR